MSFIGNVPAEAYSPVAKDTFSGDDSTTDFTLSIPATTNSVEVLVENVQQEPTTAYTISGTTLSFTAAPVTGTNNIYVIHRGPAVQQVTPPAGVAIDASTITGTGDMNIDSGTLFVDATNNRVGVGTATPLSLLHVQGTSAALQVNNDTTDYLTLKTNSTTDGFIFENGSSERMRLTGTTGNLGIATDDPLVRLHVASANAEAVRLCDTNAIDDASVASYMSFYRGEDTNRVGFIGFGSTNNAEFTIKNEVSSGGTRLFNSNSDGLIINSDGIALLGTESLPTGANASNGLRLVVDTGTGTARDGMIINGDGGNADDCFAVLNRNASGAKTCVIFGDGDIENANNNYTGFSDANLKQQIVDASSQWDDIKAMQIRKYKMNAQVEKLGDDAPMHLGVIAQELEASGMDGLVKTSPRDGHKSVKYSILYMKAVKALQEAMDRIETLETTQADLIARIEALEAN